MVQFLVSYIVLVLWLNKTLAMESLSLSMPSCPDKCGEVSIPYPFGIGPGCYFDESFAVTCRLNDSKPYLTSINMEILNISMQGFIQVNNPVISSNCSKLAVGAAMSQYSGSGYVDLGHRPFSFSSYYSRFTIVGCEIYGTIISNENNKTLGGCFSSCDNSTVVSLSEDQNGCYGLNCCQAALPTSSNLKSFKANIISTPSLKSDQVCRAAFMVDQQWFEQQQNSSIDSILNETSVVPAVLEWGKTDGSCALDNYSPNITFCSSDGFCWAMIDSSYLCVCNPKSSFNSFLSSTSSISYISGGCGGTSSILSCPSQTSFGCQLVCLEDSPNCSCPSDYEKHDTGCYPLKLIIDPVGLGNRGSFFLLVLGVLLPIAIWLLYKLMKKRKAVKQRQKFFKRNGGLLLQQQLLTSDNGMEKTKLFTSRDLEKATDKYNVDRILGQGGQGIVYKGMLRDGKIVAVKKSKVVDEAQLGQFINEVMILSQIDHRNVLKLLGFCLETEVPMLVYEFMPNGTLYEYIHDQNEELPFTWDMRLRIATEVANALSYLHSAASAPIYHRDIKSTNILLDDRYRAKVSDFGTSRSIAIDKTHLTTKVKGTFGYLDPEYFQSSLFTEKSDVYSFGVVLVELLTGQKPISSIGHEEYRNLAMLFHQSMDENRLIEILDPQVIKDGGKLNEITIVSNLAKRCLNIHGRYRPTMKEVVQELEGIRMPGRAAEPNHEADGSTFDYINRIWDTTPSSTVTFSSNDFEQPLEEEKRLITGTQ